MRALVVYESMFGNTRDIARAVADGIATRLPVDVVEVDVAPTTLPADVGLLVVGGPTHAHGLSNPKTRADAANRAGERLVSRGLSLGEWLDVLRPTGPSVATTAFDTRIKGPELLWGSAAKALAKRLSEAHFHVVAKPTSFMVGGPTGPQFDRVAPGELDRAKAWGAVVAGKVGTPAGIA